MDKKELEEFADKKRKEIFEVLKDKNSQQYKNFLESCKDKIIYNLEIYQKVFSVEDEIAGKVFSHSVCEEIYDLVKNTADKEKFSAKKGSSKEDISSVGKGKKSNKPFFIMLVIAAVLLITVMAKSGTIDNLQKSNQSLIEENKKLQNSYQMLKADYNELNGYYLQLNSKNHEFQEEIFKLTNENNKLEEENEEQANRLNNWKIYSRVN